MVWKNKLEEITLYFEYYIKIIWQVGTIRSLLKYVVCTYYTLYYSVDV